MTTSQAFRNALHVPLADPSSGNIVAVQDPGGDWYTSFWSSASGLPEAPLDGAQYVRQSASWQPVALSPASLLASIKTVDGTGSGLDADFLDGQDSTAFATKTYVDSAIAILDAGTY